MAEIYSLISESLIRHKFPIVEKIRCWHCRGNPLWLPNFIEFIMNRAGTGACIYRVGIGQHMNDPIKKVWHDNKFMNIKSPMWLPYPSRAIGLTRRFLLAIITSKKTEP